MTTINGIDKEKWAEFLQDFSRRNYNRRLRFEIFRGSDVREERQEGHLENVSLELEGADAPCVIIKRRDEGGTQVRESVEAIPSVRRISVQYDTDHSEDALEIEDTKGTLILLHLESKVDGAS